MPHDEIAKLYAVADDHETSVLDALRERAGLTWTCHNQAKHHGNHDWTNEAGERCGLCGAMAADASMSAPMVDAGAAVAVYDGDDGALVVRSTWGALAEANGFTGEDAAEIARTGRLAVGGGAAGAFVVRLDAGPVDTFVLSAETDGKAGV